MPNSFASHAMSKEFCLSSRIQRFHKGKKGSSFWMHLVPHPQIWNLLGRFWQCRSHYFTSPRMNPARNKLSCRLFSCLLNTSASNDSWKWIEKLRVEDTSMGRIWPEAAMFDPMTVALHTNTEGPRFPVTRFIWGARFWVTRYVYTGG